MLKRPTGISLLLQDNQQKLTISLSQVTVDPPLEHPTSDLAVTSETSTAASCGFYDADFPRTWDCNT